MTAAQLITPYGGQLVDLCPTGEALLAAKAAAVNAPKLVVSSATLSDLELLATGACSPLTGFLGHQDYWSVVSRMRLADGRLWPIPITLEAPADFTVAPGASIALCDQRNVLVALMRVEDVFEADLEAEARLVYGGSEEHPAVGRLRRGSRRRLGGPLQVLQLPPHYDFKSLRLTPAETRRLFAERGWTRVAAFQARTPLYRAHEAVLRRVAGEFDGVLLHGVAGVAPPGDFDHYTRVRCYQELLKGLGAPNVVLALLPLTLRLAGPREALWHALLRRNYGCAALVVGREHATPGCDAQGRPFYPAGAAQALVREHEAETGVAMVASRMGVYLRERKAFVPPEELPPGTRGLQLDELQIRNEYLARGRELPDWFARPEVAQLLAEACLPRRRQGVTIWLTGLSSSGKSTLAEVLAQRLLEHGRRSTVLDGDIVRQRLSKGLGFSKEDRDTNILRIGFVAAEITRHGGTVIAAAISPYRQIRQENRERIGNYVEVYVNTQIEVCEQRDLKGNYQRARAGLLKGFTGVDDPYEPPIRDFVEVHPDRETPEESAEQVLAQLLEQGYI